MNYRRVWQCLRCCKETIEMKAVATSMGNSGGHQPKA